MAKDNRKKGKKEKDSDRPKAAKTAHAKIVISLVAILAVVFAGYFFLRNSDYFKLETIQVIDASRSSGLSSDQVLDMYKNRNIFEIDIVTLSSRIKNQYPQIKDAVVRRILPNAIEIDIIPRVAVAKIKAQEYFPVDETGMVLSPEAKTGKLPVVMGFSSWFKPRIGERINNKQLENAFLLINAMKESSFYSDYSVTTIDASNYRNLSFYLENGIEIKMGDGDFKARLKSLKTILAKPDLDKESIKYIDLRFKDVVIGPK